MSNQFIKDLDCHIRARYPLIYLLTWEEERARKILMDLADQHRKALHEWSITDGLRLVAGPGSKQSPPAKRVRKPMEILNDILQADGDALYVLKDFHAYLEPPEVVRQLRDLSQSLRQTKKTIIILAPVLKMPPELEKCMTILDMPLPTYDDLYELLRQTAASGAKARRFKVELSNSQAEALVKAAQGLTLLEAENAFAHAIAEDSVLDGRDVSAVVDEKKQVIRKSGVLEYYDVDETLASVGGMDLLKDWLNKRVRAFSDKARQYGLPEPRGMLLMGVQGCGKTLMAKSIASSWRLPLLRMDMSRIFEGYIGSSEQNMRKAVKVAESLAPVVLWIDEIEKAFSGIEGSGSSDAGTTARVVGTFLTWIQEKTAPVFVVATANRIHGLPPELLRKGRFDEVFFVDLPHGPERAEIFRIHLKKLGRDPAKFDLVPLVKASKEYSGAEIEQAIISALHESFFENRELATQDILNGVQATVPLSRTMREEIEALRVWARPRARPVSSRQGPKRTETA